MKKSFAIMRFRKMSTNAQLSGMQRHNDRTNNVKNADEDLRHENRDWSKYDTYNIIQDVDRRIEETGVKVKSNSVKCMEFLMTASPDFFTNRKAKDEEKGGYKVVNCLKWKRFERLALEWLKEEFGENNLVNYSIHKDEMSPHIHAYVTPIKEKLVKYKNRFNSGEKIKNSLCARDFCNGKKEVSALQDRFYDKVKHLGLERGKKGSKAKHQDVKKYYTKVNQDVEFDKKLEDFTPEIPKVKIPKRGIERESKYLQRVEEVVNNALQQSHKDGANQLANKYKGDFYRVDEANNIIKKVKEENVKREVAYLDSIDRHKLSIIQIEEQNALTSMNLRDSRKQTDAIAKDYAAFLKDTLEALKGDQEANLRIRQTLKDKGFFKVEKKVKRKSNNDISK